MLLLARLPVVIFNSVIASSFSLNTHYELGYCDKTMLVLSQEWYLVMLILPGHPLCSASVLLGLVPLLAFWFLRGTFPLACFKPLSFAVGPFVLCFLVS